MVWEAKPGSGTNELVLQRGEELLEVNGHSVEGKKLAQIYKLITDQASADVELKIKAIQSIHSIEGMYPIPIALKIFHYSTDVAC